MWKSRGPTGGPVSLVTDRHTPGTLYARGNYAITYKSADAAVHWKPFEAAGVSILAVDPQDSNSFYGAGSNGLVKSVDGGASWTNASAGLPRGPSAGAP